MLALFIALLLAVGTLISSSAFADDEKEAKKDERKDEKKDEKEEFDDDKDPFADEPTGKTEVPSDGKPKRASDPFEKEKVPVLREIDASEAGPLAASLKKAARKSDAATARKAIVAIEKVKHATFAAPLIKLLTHDSSKVAVAAARALSYRCDDAKLRKKIWKASYVHKSNKRRYGVKGELLRMFARMGMTLNDRQYKDVERDFRAINGNPSKSGGKAFADFAWYAGTVKDKRFARALAEQLDEPAPGDVNSPSNPPASWWEKKWNMWKACRADAARALREITGKEFEKTAEAKAWIKGPGKKLGFDW